MTDELPLRELHLFAGAGGGILGGELLGHTCVCAVEIEEYPRRVLLQRQRDGILPRFPIWDDICTFDGKPWRGRVDVVCGGFPCQDISSAGKGAGIGGKRSGLWSEMARVISEVRPRFVFVENSPLLVSDGLDRVLSDLAEMGYDAKWGVVGAHHVGGAICRDRAWVLGIDRKGLFRGTEGIGQLTEKQAGQAPALIGTIPPRTNWWKSVQGVPRMANGMADQLEQRQSAIGNGQVPAVAALAWRLLGGPV